MASAGSERPAIEGSKLGETYGATCRAMEGTEESKVKCDMILVCLAFFVKMKSHDRRGIFLSFICTEVRYFVLTPSSSSRSVSGCLTAVSLSTLRLCGTTSTLCWITEFTLPPSTPPSVYWTTCRAAL